MLKFVIKGTRDDEPITMLGLGLSAGNVRYLQQGKPILIETEEVGTDRFDQILICAGETEDDIVSDLREAGVMPS